MSIPCLEAAPIPPKKPRGIDTTKAQGQDTTRNIKARYSHSLKLNPVKNGGIIASASAKKTTAGV